VQAVDAPARVAALQGHCREAGLRLTDLRAEVYRMLLAADGPVKAYTLLHRLREDRPAARPPTVYRALAFLVDIGAVHRVDAISAFVACAAPGHRHVPQILLCARCQRVVEVASFELGESARRAARAHGFTAELQGCVLSGTCSDCAQAGDA
jgi:Fur family zinc uptake transcriptional regulator